MLKPGGATDATPRTNWFSAPTGNPKPSRARERRAELTRLRENKPRAEKETGALCREKFPWLISCPDLYSLSFQRSPYINRSHAQPRNTRAASSCKREPLATVTGHARVQSSGMDFICPFHTTHSIESSTIGELIERAALFVLVLRGSIFPSWGYCVLCHLDSRGDPWGRFRHEKRAWAQTYAKWR